MNVVRGYPVEWTERFLMEIGATHLQSCSEEHPVSLLESPLMASSPFDLRAVVHPTVASVRLTKATVFLVEYAYKTFPVYKCEFARGEAPDEIRFRLVKFLQYNRHDREPAPAIWARFHRYRSGVRTTGRRLGMMSFEELSRVFDHVDEEDGFIEFENFERYFFRVEHEDGEWRVHQDDDQWVARPDKIRSWFRKVCVEGREAADMARDEYAA